MKNNISEKLKKLYNDKKIIILSLIFIVYLAFNLILLFGHELWRDEANVWLITRELSPIELFRQIKYQGHPCLWYLLVMPFAKAGLPFKTISVLSFIIMAFTGGVFVYRAPFNPVIKFLLLVSPIFSYYYPVIARNYCLIALILILLAYLFPKRKDRPILYGVLIALLIQSDTIALAPAGMIWLWNLWGDVRSLWARTNDDPSIPVWKKLTGHILPIFSIGLLFLQFKGVSGSSEFRVSDISLSSLPVEISNNVAHIFGRLTGTGTAVALSLFIFILVVMFIMSVERKNFFTIVTFFLSVLYEALFSIMIYQLHIWHFISLLFVMIWAFWILTDADDGLVGKIAPEASLLTVSILALTAVLTFVRWNLPEENNSFKNALVGVYSDGKDTASYIRKNIPSDSLVFSTNVSECSTVLAYLPRRYEFIYAGSLQKASYADYNEDQNGTVTLEEFLDYVQNDHPLVSEFYILKSNNGCITDLSEHMDSMDIRYETGVITARGEEYTLLRVQR